jgi:hypothetical protein
VTGMITAGEAAAGTMDATTAVVVETGSGEGGGWFLAGCLLATKGTGLHCATVALEQHVC